MIIFAISCIFKHDEACQWRDAQSCLPTSIHDDRYTCVHNENNAQTRTFMLVCPISMCVSQEHLLLTVVFWGRQVAGRTLGDVVRKLGERVLPEIIPILERGLDSEEPDQRQGVCIGLSEIMASISRDHVSLVVPAYRRISVVVCVWGGGGVGSNVIDSLTTMVGEHQDVTFLPLDLHFT